MAKSIPTKEFKVAVKAFNTVLKNSEGETPIKVVTVKKEKILENFTNKVLDFIEKDKAADLPDEVIDFYNEHIVEEEEEKENSSDKEKKSKKKSKENKNKKKNSPPKKDNPRKDYMAKLITEGKYTAKEICDKTFEKFPNVKWDTVSANLRDCKNSNYNFFPGRLAQKNPETKIFTWKK